MTILPDKTAIVVHSTGTHLDGVSGFIRGVFPSPDITKTSSSMFIIEVGFKVFDNYPYTMFALSSEYVKVKK